MRSVAMLWWPKRGESVGDQDGVPGTTVKWALADRSIGKDCPGTTAPAGRPVSGDVKAFTLRRLGDTLDALEIRYIRDPDGAMFAMWERHAVLFAVEGPADEILVIRSRPHATVPGDWAHRAYTVVNEWNHMRRFCKAYVGDPTASGRLPIYGEWQVPLVSGIHDELLAELVQCGVSVSECFVEWLYDEGALF